MHPALRDSQAVRSQKICQARAHFFALRLEKRVEVTDIVYITNRHALPLRLSGYPLGSGQRHARYGGPWGART